MSVRRSWATRWPDSWRRTFTAGQWSEAALWVALTFASVAMVYPFLWLIFS